jgi:La domain
MSNPENSDSRNKPILHSGAGMETDTASPSDKKECRDDSEKGESIVKITKLSSIVLKKLALQLEYYFSTHNLSKDTYLQTLRSLNDGCVPARILANFGKVKSIAALDGEAAFLSEECRINAILDTIREKHTELFQIHSIDARTGKITSSGCIDLSVPGKTIIAIGTTSKEPLNVDPVATSPLLMSRSITSPASSRTNTIILRDVPLTVTEEEIRTLLNEIYGCPPIANVIKDVANCW